jgi:hypothetical protein
MGRASNGAFFFGTVTMGTPGWLRYAADMVRISPSYRGDGDVNDARHQVLSRRRAFLLLCLLSPDVWRRAKEVMSYDTLVVRQSSIDG